MRSVSIGRWTALATVDANSLVTAQGVGTAGSPQDEGDCAAQGRLLLRSAASVFCACSYLLEVVEHVSRKIV